jgi:hypothetical protein
MTTVRVGDMTFVYDVLSSKRVKRDRGSYTRDISTTKRPIALTLEPREDQIEKSILT